MFATNEQKDGALSLTLSFTSLQMKATRFYHKMSFSTFSEEGKNVMIPISREDINGKLLQTNQQWVYYDSFMTKL